MLYSCTCMATVGVKGLQLSQVADCCVYVCVVDLYYYYYLC